MMYFYCGYRVLLPSSVDDYCAKKVTHSSFRSQDDGKSGIPFIFIRFDEHFQKELQLFLRSSSSRSNWDLFPCVGAHGGWMGPPLHYTFIVQYKTTRREKEGKGKLSVKNLLLLPAATPPNSWLMALLHGSLAQQQHKSQITISAWSFIPLFALNGRAILLSFSSICITLCYDDNMKTTRAMGIGHVQLMHRYNFGLSLSLRVVHCRSRRMGTGTCSSLRTLWASGGWLYGAG